MELHLNFAVKLATYTTNATYTFLKNIGKKNVENDIVPIQCLENQTWFSLWQNGVKIVAVK